jgi:hypothetical protein
VGIRALMAVAVCVAVAALCWLGPGAAGAAVPDACGAMREGRIAHAFGLARVMERTTVVAPLGNESGVLRTSCRVLSWSGSRPTNESEKREAMSAGRLAWLKVNTWVTDRSRFAPRWRAHFNGEVKTLRASSVELFVKRLDGRGFVPPRYGAEEAIAYRAESSKTARVRGLWWNRRDKSIIELNVEEAAGKPAVASLKRIAAVVTRRFNSECVFPCEPPASG